MARLLSAVVLVPGNIPGKSERPEITSSKDFQSLLSADGVTLPIAAQGTIQIPLLVIGKGLPNLLDKDAEAALLATSTSRTDL